jgi:hypothetical protein
MLPIKIQKKRNFLTKAVSHLLSVIYELLFFGFFCGIYALGIGETCALGISVRNYVIWRKTAVKSEKMRVSGDQGIRKWISGYQGTRKLTIDDWRLTIDDFGGISDS